DVVIVAEADGPRPAPGIHREREERLPGARAVLEPADLHLGREVGVERAVEVGLPDHRWKPVEPLLEAPGGVADREPGALGRELDRRRGISAREEGEEQRNTRAQPADA